MAAKDGLVMWHDALGIAGHGIMAPEPDVDITDHAVDIRDLALVPLDPALVVVAGSAV